MVGGQLFTNPLAMRPLLSCDQVSNQTNVLQYAQIFIGADGAVSAVPEGQLGPPDARRPSDRDDPSTPRSNENEIERINKVQSFLEQGYDGLCFRGAAHHRRWFMWSDKANSIALRNIQPYSAANWDAGQIELSVGQVKELVNVLGLGLTDISIVPGEAPREKEGGTIRGKYQFINNKTRLDQIVRMLEGNPEADPPTQPVKLTSFSGEERSRLIAHLKEITAPVDAQLDMLDQQASMPWKTMLGQFGMQVILTLPLLYIFRKQLGLTQRGVDLTQESVSLTRKAIEGDPEKNALHRFSHNELERARKQLSQNIFQYEILGKDKEALEYLRTLVDPIDNCPFLDGKSGSGKDLVVKRAAQLLVLGDDRIPTEVFEKVQDIRWIQPGAFLAGGKYRGDIAERVENFLAALRGGAVGHFPEFLKNLNAGSASGSNAESLGLLLLEPLTEEEVRFSGSGTPDDTFAMKSEPQFNNLDRRFVDIKVKGFPLEAVRMRMQNYYVPYFSDYFHMQISEDAVELAIHAALSNMPEHRESRNDEVSKVLKRSFSEARAEGARNVTSSHVAKAASAIYRVDIPEDFRFQDPFPTLDARIEQRNYGQRSLSWLESDPWFQQLDQTEKRRYAQLAMDWVLNPREGKPAVREGGSGEASLILVMEALREVHERHLAESASMARDTMNGRTPVRAESRARRDKGSASYLEQFLKRSVVDFADYGVMDQLEILTAFENDVRARAVVGENGRLRITEEELADLLRRRVGRAKPGEMFHEIKLREQGLMPEEVRDGWRGRGGGGGFRPGGR